MYDIIGSGVSMEEIPESMTIGNLIELALEYPDKEFRFVGTSLYPGKLMSWRGVYALPAIDYTSDVKTGRMLSEGLRESLSRMHHDWKGGEYSYSRGHIFRVSARGEAEDYQVVGYKVEDHEVILLTKSKPY